jgi:hypothetical protein
VDLVPDTLLLRKSGTAGNRTRDMKFATIQITVIILDILHDPKFYLKLDVSESEFCLHLRLEQTHLGPVNISSLCIRTGSETEARSIY